MGKVQNIRISVAMATYNGEKYLREQLDSLYRQTLLPFEIIVVDDCSTDCTVEILKEYEMRYGLKYFVNEQNMGVNKNFFKAISLCSGDYVAICDQDDIWFKDKIEITVKKLIEIENGKPAVVSSQNIEIDKVGNIIRKAARKRDSFGYVSNLLCTGNVQGCTLMLNKQVIKIVLSTYKDSLSYIMYDGYISFVAAMTGYKYNIGEPLMYYRHHETNVLAKEQKNSPSFLSRVENQYTFVDFIPDTRFKTIPVVFEQCKEYVYDKDIVNLVLKIEQIGKCDFLEGLRRILGLHELSLMRKLKICIKSILVQILKLLIIK